MKLTKPTKIVAVIVALLAIASIALQWDFSPATPVNAATDSALTAAGNDYVMGSPTAPVTIIEYFSLSCGHCAHFNNDVLPALKKKYIDTGKVKFISRTYVRNEPDLKASLLLYCLPPEKFHSFQDVLLKQQEKWAFDENFLQSLKIIAAAGGVPANMFNACMANSKNEIAILKLRNDASQNLLIESTPSFFINGKKFKGTYDVDGLSREIDALLKGEKI